MHVYSCYFPTARDPDEQVEHLYVLDLMVDYSRKTSAMLILGSDFDSNVASADRGVGSGMSKRARPAFYSMGAVTPRSYH